MLLSEKLRRQTSGHNRHGQIDYISRQNHEHLASKHTWRRRTTQWISCHTGEKKHKCHRNAGIALHTRALGLCLPIWCVCVFLCWKQKNLTRNTLTRCGLFAFCDNSLRSLWLSTQRTKITTARHCSTQTEVVTSIHASSVKSEVCFFLASFMVLWLREGSSPPAFSPETSSSRLG